MNVQHFTRIGFVYLEEAVLAVFFQAKENAEKAIRQADISKRMGIHPYADKASWTIYGILRKLKTEEHISDIVMHAIERSVGSFRIMKVKIFLFLTLCLCVSGCSDEGMMLSEQVFFGVVRWLRCRLNLQSRVCLKELQLLFWGDRDDYMEQLLGLPDHADEKVAVRDPSGGNS